MEATEQKMKEEESKKSVTRDQDIEVMYSQLKNEDMSVPLDKLFKEIKSVGLIIERDPRLHELYTKSCQISDGCFKDVKLLYEDFYRIVKTRKKLISNCLTKRLKIENFSDFSETIDAFYQIQQSNISGKLSNEFPELEQVNINKWGLAVCSVDGQRKFAGDSNITFTMQDLCKPLLLGLLLKKSGLDTLKKYVSFEPNNVGKDVVELNEQGKPFNTMINTGAIMVCALLTAISYKGKNVSFIHETYMNYVKELIADEYVDFKASSYISKQESADELRCLGYGIKSSSVMPPECNIVTSLDLFLKACSVQVTSESLSVLAATLANGGYNPFTEKRILETDDVKEILSAMYSYGLYQFSGEGSFTIGLPMKSSCSGGLILVVPKKMGIALYSPLLNDYGISERSYQFCKEIVKKLKLHNFDSLGDMVMKKFPDRREKKNVCEPFCELLSAAASNDIATLTRLQDKKADFYATDCFGHSALHVAAVKGSYDAVKFILNSCPSLANLKDKWERTAQMYASELKYFEIAKYLERFELSHSIASNKA